MTAFSEKIIPAEERKARQILLVCAACGKQRGENGYWTVFSEDAGEAAAHPMISHGLCPACLTLLYPEYFGMNH